MPVILFYPLIYTKVLFKNKKKRVNFFVYGRKKPRKTNNSGAGVEKNTDILSRKAASVFLGVCLTTLDRLDIPKTRIRHRLMYKREILNNWIDDHTGKVKRGKA